jgi:hypothetical protein
MPVLPLIDLLLLVAWTSLVWAFIHKAIWLALAANFTIFGLTPIDFATGSALCLLFATTLSARTWVKLNEHKILRRAARRTVPNEVLPNYPDPSEAPGAARSRGAARF